MFNAHVPMLTVTVFDDQKWHHCKISPPFGPNPFFGLKARYMPVADLLH